MFTLSGIKFKNFTDLLKIANDYFLSFAKGVGQLTFSL